MKPPRTLPFPKPDPAAAHAARLRANRVAFLKLLAKGKR